MIKSHFKIPAFLYDGIIFKKLEKIETLSLL